MLFNKDLVVFFIYSRYWFKPIELGFSQSLVDSKHSSDPLKSPPWKVWPGVRIRELRSLVGPHLSSSLVGACIIFLSADLLLSGNAID